MTAAASVAVSSVDISMPSMMVGGSSARVTEMLSICKIAPDVVSILSIVMVRSCAGLVPPKLAPETAMVSFGSYPDPPLEIEATS